MVEALRDSRCGSIEVRVLTTRRISFAIDDSDWWDFSRLLLAVVRSLADSAINMVCLDCSTMLALMKECSCSMLLVSDCVMGVSLSVIAANNSMVMFPVSFCIIRKPTALMMMDAELSGILLLSDVVKRMLASVSAV